MDSVLRCYVVWCGVMRWRCICNALRCVKLRCKALKRKKKKIEITEQAKRLLPHKRLDVLEAHRRSRRLFEHLYSEKKGNRLNYHCYYHCHCYCYCYCRCHCHCHCHCHCNCVTVTVTVTVFVSLSL